MTNRFHSVESVGSTNRWVAEHAAELDSGAVVYTLNQTAGRGRHGREWSSTPGETLAFSLLLDSMPPGFHRTWVPLVSGACVANAVRNLGADLAVVKWPNDVLINGEKLAGILVEVLADGRMVVGVGINVFSTVESLPDPRATSLQLQGVNVTDPLPQIVVPVVETIERVIVSGLGKNTVDAHKQWRDYVTPLLSTLGAQVSYETSQGGMSHGRARALSDDGALIISPDDGEGDVAIHSGDVFHIERS